MTERRTRAYARGTPAREERSWYYRVANQPKGNQPMRSKPFIWVIETTHDVTNPEVDRRSKDWFKAPVIKAGTRFVVRKHPQEGRDPTLSRIVPSGRRARLGESLPRVAKLARMIEDAAKEVEPKSLSEMIAVADAPDSADYILELLFRSGRIGFADFQAVATLADADAEAEEAAALSQK